MTYPLDLALRDELTLDSAYITVDGRPVDLQKPLVLQGGSALKVSLLWSAQQQLDQDYAVFVHILDDNGALVAQHDGIPLFGTRPTYTWLEGEQLLDRHELMLPEQVSGSGRLIVGLYDTATFERQELVPGQGEFLLSDITFE